ncbi:MAG: hypothetical protein IT285_11095 [Bdellovibrionales bacterium]|nr:hypothetical protein [Bdellovibrionales bacterium]
MRNRFFYPGVSVPLVLLSTLLALSGAGCQGGDACDENGANGLITVECSEQKLVEEGLDVLLDDRGGALAQWPEILPAGETLAEAFDPESPTVTLSADSRFYLADLSPGAMWNHGVMFVLVDVRTGEISIHFRSSYPRLSDGSVLFASENTLAADWAEVPGFPTVADALARLESSEARGSGDRAEPLVPSPPPVTSRVPGADDPRFANYPKLRPTEPDSLRLQRFQAQFELPQTDDEVSAALEECPKPDSCEGEGKKFALVVNGGRLYEGSTDEMATALRAKGYSTQSLSPKHPAVADSEGNRLATPANVRAAFQALAAQVTSCCDEVVVLFYAHGSPRGMMEINQLQDERLPGGGTQRIGHADGGDLSRADFKAGLDSLKTCQTKVFIQSCYAGSHLELGLNEISDAVASQGCLCRTVAVSSSARQESWGGPWDFTTKYAETGNFDESVKTAVKADQPWPDEPHKKVTRLVQSTDCFLCDDPDGDFLITAVEIKDNYSDPNQADTDGDGLPDGYEREIGSSPRDTDSDDDNLSDADEVERGTSPINEDTDGDGLKDKHELFVECDPLDSDSDDDGLTDGQEVLTYNTNPRNKDTDGDTAEDGYEVERGTDPRDPNSF